MKYQLKIQFKSVEAIVKLFKITTFHWTFKTTEGNLFKRVKTPYVKLTVATKLKVMKWCRLNSLSIKVFETALLTIAEAII